MPKETKISVAFREDYVSPKVAYWTIPGIFLPSKGLNSLITKTSLTNYPYALITIPLIFPTYPVLLLSRFSLKKSLCLPIEK